MSAMLMQPNYRDCSAFPGLEDRSSVLPTISAPAPVSGPAAPAEGAPAKVRTPRERPVRKAAEEKKISGRPNIAAARKKKL